jgi:transposase
MNENIRAWGQRTAFAGFDWASEHHDVVVVDSQGAVVEHFRFDNTLEGWQQLRDHLVRYPQLAVAIETSSGAAVERLLEAGCAVFPVNPRSAKGYRARQAPSGTKTDYLDAWSLADALRLDGAQWRQLHPDQPLTVELRLLCRDEIALIEQRTALVNQLRAALREYYPTALRAFDDWTARASWAFVERFPTPQALRAAGQRKWEKFLHTNKLYHSQELYAKRLELFAAAEQFCGSPAVTNAKSLLARTVAGQLRVLEDHLDEYRRQITERFEQHPDHDLFGSLPGLGEKLGPRMLSTLGDDRARFDSAEGLQCYAGTAPVSYLSGKGSKRKARLRRACEKTLRATVHLWANLSRRVCPWAEAYYQQKRAAGQSHACALRCLGQRWLKILWKMWQTHSLYDAELHHRNQVRHGSWVIALQAANTAPTPATL